jgi:type IV secretion system protein VirB6
VLYRVAFALLFIILAVPANAQSTLTPDQLRAIAQQDAINAGLPPDFFLAQIQGESSFNPNVGCNGASANAACGIAQFIPSTAAQFNLDPSDPVASLQAAAQYDAQLLQSQGSLVGALTAYSGGCTPANPCNASYAQAFQAAQAFDSGGGTGTATSTGSGGSTLSTTATSTSQTPQTCGSADPGHLPFQWVYCSVITDGILAQIDETIRTVESIVSGPATAVLALAIAIMGFMTLFGNMDMPVFISFAIRAAVVMAFIQVGNTFYSEWIEGFILGLPDYFAQAFSLTGHAGSPAQLFDQVLNGWIADVVTIWHETGWSLHAGAVIIVAGLLTVVIVLPSLVAMFTVFLISTFLLLTMLAIGPLLILGLLFRTTHRFLHGYVNVVVTGIIFALVVDIVLGIFSNILSQLISIVNPAHSASSDMAGLFGLAITLLITGFSMARLPRLVEAIGGGVAVSMDTAGRFVSGGFAADAASTASSAVARVL